MTFPLLQVVYLSAAWTPFTQKALREMLSQARVKNRRLGVTGFLLHAEGSFLQVLEGPAPSVEPLFATISTDRRHHRVTRIFQSDLHERVFGDWTMGFAEAEGDVRSGLLGFNGFIQNPAITSPGGAAAGPAADKIRELAVQFRLGRWRQSIETWASPRRRPA